jgi:hypothetical protein
LELVRVDVGVERPPGAPARDAAWPSTSGRWTEKKPTLSARAADLCETALVVACLGAADPHGAGAGVSLALAAGGAARAATFAVAARRYGQSVSAADGETSAREPVSARMEPAKPSRLGGWSRRVSDPKALVARLCDAAFLLHVSGGALRLVAPESHHAVKSAAALLGVRVAFSRPTKKRRRIGKNARPSSVANSTNSTGASAGVTASRDDCSNSSHAPVTSMHRPTWEAWTWTRGTRATAGRRCVWRRSCPRARNRPRLKRRSRRWRASPSRRAPPARTTKTTSSAAFLFLSVTVVRFSDAVRKRTE